MKPLTAAEYLKVSTRESHRQTERAADSKAIMRGSINREDYLLILRANYLVWRDTEQAIRAQLSLASPLSPSWRIFQLNFTPYLVKDLQQLGVENRFLELLNEPPKLPNEAAILGALYVLNGSTLGGKYLYQALLDNKKLVDLQDFHFYRACSEVPAGYWPRFQNCLNELLTTDRQREEAKQSAINIFEKFKRAYQGNKISENIIRRNQRL